MKIQLFLYLHTSVKYTSVEGEKTHKILMASFFRTVVTNALPQKGHILYIPETIEGIGRHFRKAEQIVAPTVDNVRQCLRRGVLDHEVIYKQNVELTTEEVCLPSRVIDEAAFEVIDSLEAQYLKAVIIPMLKKEGFLFNMSASPVEL